METTSRFNTINKFFEENVNQIDSKKLIDFLSSHNDHYDNQEYIFGTSLARVSNIFTSIVAPKEELSYLSLGDSVIANHGTYIKVKSNFKTGEFNILETMSRTQDNFTSNIVDLYGLAYLDHLVGNDEEALKKLISIDLKEDAHLNYIIGRLYFELKDFENAYKFITMAKNNFKDEYRIAKANIYLIYSSDQVETINLEVNERNQMYLFSQNIFESILKGKNYHNNFVTIAQPVNYGKIHGKLDIKKKLKTLEKVYKKNYKKLKFDSVDMSSVD